MENTRRSSRTKRSRQVFGDSYVFAEDERRIRQAMRASAVLHQKVELNEIEDCPCYHPTEKEFRDPMAFVKSIYREVEPFGICRVVPPASWKPPKILNDDKPEQFNTRLQNIHSLQEAVGFADGRKFTLKSYREYSEQLFHEYFGTSRSETRAKRDILEMEKEFWTLVEKSHRQWSVEYGNDIDSVAFGSGFPSSDSDNAYAKDPWNLNNIAMQPESVIRLLGNYVSGITAPWVYMGTLFSAFCWHVEDNYLFSVNYLHFGDEKVWYGAPASAAVQLEECLREQVPDLFSREPDLIHKLVTLLSPTVLKARGVPVCRAVQRPGDLIFTWPRGFHAGFNAGFNCAEAVNFASNEWLPYGSQAIEDYRKYRRASAFSHERLLLQLILSGCTDDILVNEVQNLIKKEEAARKACRRMGLSEVSAEKNMEGSLDEQMLASVSVKQCSACKHNCFLSYAACHKCSTKERVCLEHVSQLSCRCPTSFRTLYINISLSQLRSLIE